MEKLKVILYSSFKKGDSRKNHLFVYKAHKRGAASVFTRYSVDTPPPGQKEKGNKIREDNYN